jgi:hypothetical protein
MISACSKRAVHCRQTSAGGIRTICWLFFVKVVFCVISHSAAHCDEAPTPTVVSPDQIGNAASVLDGPDLVDHPSWKDTLRAVLLTAVPDKYEDLKHWNKTKEVWSGVRVQQRGFQLRVSDRKRTVNHGAWHKYRIELVDPNQSLKLIIHEIRPVAANRFQFQVQLGAKLRCRGDFEHWVLGVKGLNMTVISNADVEILADCELSIQPKTNGKSILPDLIMEPKVKRVQIFLRNLDVQRIGEIRGDIAEGIGDISRHDIENLIQAQEVRVQRKINEALEKQKDRLIIPASRLW